MDLTEEVKKYVESGHVRRVIIDPYPETVNFKRAQEEYGITPDVVFIRDDGWTLGAQYCHSDVAYRMWAESWTHFYLVQEQELKPISDYKI